MHDGAVSDQLWEDITALQEGLDRLREDAGEENADIVRELESILDEIRSALRLRR